MRSRNLVLIALLALCCLQPGAQTLTNATGDATLSADLPDDPGQEALPLAQPEPQPATGVPVQLEAQRQSRVGDVLTLAGDVVVHYKDYILRADKAVYNQSTT
jgi:LPS-assembly protein